MISIDKILQTELLIVERKKKLTIKEKQSFIEGFFSLAKYINNIKKKRKLISSEYDEIPELIKEEMFKRHSHAEIEYDTHPDTIVYSEQDVIFLMNMAIENSFNIKNKKK